MKNIRSARAVVFASLLLWTMGQPRLRAEESQWPSFRGPQASGVSESANLPIRWNAETGENIAWKTAIPGLAHSSPIVWDGRVFITTAVSGDPDSKFRPGLYGDIASVEDASDHQWLVYALDAATGETIWKKSAHEGKPKVKRHPKSSHASATPATDGEHLVVFFASEGLFCFGLDGDLHWRKDLGVLDSGFYIAPKAQWAAASSPIIYKDRVIVQCDMTNTSFIAAFALKDGAELWRTERDELPTWSTPTVVETRGEALLIAHGSKFARGYDPMTGVERWRLGPHSDIPVPTPVVGHGLIYLTSAHGPIHPTYAVRLGARGDVSLAEGGGAGDHIAWAKKSEGVYLSTPIVYGDYFYACSNRGVLRCYDARSGERLFQQRVGGDTGGAITASPVAGGGYLYYPAEDGEVHVIKAGPKYDLVASNPMGEVLMASPAIAGNMLIVRGQHHLFAIAGSK